MERFGLIGRDIAHSESPELFRKAYGGRWEYDLMDFDCFADAWRAFVEGPHKAVNVTSPFKTEAASRAGIKAPEVERTGAANILIKTPEGILARNSDYLGLCVMLRGLKGTLLPQSGTCDVAVIGMGGAGMAAKCAAEDCGFRVSVHHHDGIADGVTAGIIIYTLPSFVPGADRLCCDVLIEANYKSPALENEKHCRPHYIGGRQWLLAQAREGFPLMTGTMVGF